MRQCACGEHLKHIVCFHRFHEIEIIDAHNGLSHSCILCSLNLWAFTGRFDWNRLPTVELERHDIQNDRENQNTKFKCIDCLHATDYAYKWFIKCLVQTTVAPSSWFVYVINGSFFWLWQGFYIQSPRITRLMVFLYKFVNVEKRREVLVAFGSFDAIW